jgi:hypothetical protein
LKSCFLLSLEEFHLSHLVLHIIHCCTCLSYSWGCCSVLSLTLESMSTQQKSLSESNSRALLWSLVQHRQLKAEVRLQLLGYDKYSYKTLTGLCCISKNIT